MAYYAQLDENNIVLKVIKYDVANGPEVLGEEQCSSLFGGKWKQTSYNGTIRKHFAGEGFKYDEKLDVFIPPQPFANWVLNTSTYLWDPPYPCPSPQHIWDEETSQWELKNKLFFKDYGSFPHLKDQVEESAKLLNFKPFEEKIVYSDDDFSLGGLWVNQIIFVVLIEIRNKSSYVAKKFLEKCNEIQKLLNVPMYAMDASPNEFYEDITLSPAWKIGSLYGFEFLENATFNGKQYFILRRSLEKAYE